MCIYKKHWKEFQKQYLIPVYMYYMYNLITLVWVFIVLNLPWPPVANREPSGWISMENMGLPALQISTFHKAIQIKSDQTVQINKHTWLYQMLIKIEKNHYYLYENYMVLLWTKLNLIHPRMLCAKFGWNWPSGSGEEDFLISSMYFHYFVIISPWKRVGPSFEQSWILFTQGYFVPSLVEIAQDEISPFSRLNGD